MRIFKFGICLAISSVLVIATQPVLAESSATVAATVQTELISVEASVSSLDYGQLNFGSTKTNETKITLTNNGNVAEKIQIKGSDAIEKSDNSKVWNISNSVGINSYMHLFQIPIGSGVGPSALTSEYYNLIPDTWPEHVIAPSGTVTDIGLTINTPSMGSYGGTFDTTVVFMAIKAP